MLSQYNLAHNPQIPHSYGPQPKKLWSYNKGFTNLYRLDRENNMTAFFSMLLILLGLLKHISFESKTGIRELFYHFVIV